MTKSTTLKSIASTNSITLSSKDTLKTALFTMKKHAISSIVVVDERGAPTGIFTEHDALVNISKKIETHTPLESIMTAEPLCVEETLLIHNAYMIMEEKRFRHLIVVDAYGLFVGVVTEGDFLRQLGFDTLSNSKLVHEIMSPKPLALEHTTLLNSAMELMQEQHYEYAIVLKESLPIGIITERDILTHYSNVIETQNTSLERLLKKDIQFVHKDTPLQEATQLMEEHGTQQLIIVDSEQKLIGLLTRHDILHAIHGAYFEFLIDVIDKKSDTIESVRAQHDKILKYHQIIQKSETKLQTLFEIFPYGLFTLDLESGHPVDCNSLSYEQLGYTHEEFKKLRISDINTMESPQEYQRRLKRIIEQGHDVFETKFSHKDGSLLEIEVNVKYITLVDKPYLMIVTRDVTQHNRKDALLAKVQSLAHIGTWEWRRESDAFIASHQASTIFNIAPNQSLSLDTLLSLIHPQDCKEYKDTLLQSLKTKYFGNLTYRICTKKDEIKWIKSYGEFILDTNGDIIKAIGIVQDITELIKYEEQLERLINYDTLTGLANRTLLLRDLESEIQNSLRHKKAFALIIFDLDRFKDVNDSFGHSAGDELLKRVSERLSKRVREGDFIARLGGDEFAILMKEYTHDEDAGILANESIKILEEEYILSSDARVHIGASAGIALYPNHAQSAETLLQNADAALYKAKAGGRGIYSYYADALTDSARARIDYATRLRRAVSNEEFEVYYQPQVHIATGRIIGAEALIRWNDPQDGLISPMLFIPIAEEIGLINEIGEWVLNDTCRQGKEWLDKGYRLTLAVNVSATQIRHQNIPLMVQKALQNTHYKAENLELEITESALMQREEEVVLMLHQLRGMGIRLAIDDFGTGYSSLSYLKRFPIDVLKIDKSFVDDLPFESDDMAIVTAIIAMGKALGFQVLAEGTERIEQIEFLKERGCILYQGYYKSRPVPAKEFEELLKANQT